MDELPKEQQDKIKKASTFRLQRNLCRAGIPEDSVEVMERQTLMETWATLVASGRDQPVEGGTLDPQFEQQRLSFEREKWLTECEERKQREAWEQRRWEAEMNDREERRKLDKEILLHKQEKRELEKANLELNKQRLKEDDATRLKKFSEALKGAIPRQTNDPLETVAFFRAVERLFLDYKVPNDLQATIVRPFLSDRSKNLVAKMDPDKSRVYKEVKELILKEYKVSPTMYRDRFNQLSKSEDQTYVMFASSLRTTLDGYIEARKVDDINHMKDLMLSDRIKSALPVHILRYVLSVEAKTENGWLPPYELAEMIDNFVANHLGNIPKAGALGIPNAQVVNQRSGNTFSREGSQIPAVSHSGVQPIRRGILSPEKISTERAPRVACWICSSTAHLARSCPNRRGKISSVDRRVNNATVVGGPGVSKSGDSKGGVGSHPKSHAADISSTDGTDVKANDAVRVYRTVLSDDDDCANYVNATHSASSLNVTRYDDSQTSCDVMAVCSPLKYVTAAVSNIDGSSDAPAVMVKALKDSGAEMAVISESVVKKLGDVVPMGTVKLSGIGGQTILCQVVRLLITILHDDDQDDYGAIHPHVKPVCVTCAVIENSADDLILPLAIIDHVGAKQQHENNVLMTDHTELEVCDNDDDFSENVQDSSVNVVTRSGFDTDVKSEQSDIIVNENSEVMDADDLMQCASDETQTIATRDILIAEQKADDSLKSCWKLLQHNKGNFCLQDGILMRYEKILGQHYTQLVVPVNRREQVLKFGHDFAAHMSPKKNLQRIRLNFWWPSMKADAISHARCCETCQMHARKTCWDRVPIQAVQRHEIPFMHWHMDIAGPMSSEKMQYPYCLLMIDSMSRYPVAFAITTPSAKNICDCLVKVWMYFGIPRYISADNATCNVAYLTTELMKRFGVTPRFITPYHSEGNSAAERLIGTTKRLIGKVAAEHPKSWYKHLPFIMWALRECPSELTGVPPWLLAMGTVPRGPLSVLRECWTGEIDLPPDLGKSPEKYLRELHHNLEVAKKYADIHAETRQQIYVDRYNTRSREKHFEVGEKVLILQPKSSTSRVFATWKGPATVVEKRSPYSYVVELDGVCYRLHANHLRRFLIKVDEVRIDGFGNPASVMVNTCAIIRDEDQDFGNVQTCPSLQPSYEVLPSQCVDPSTLSHLSADEQQQLLAVLDRYPDVFKDEPGLYKGIKHTVPTTPDFRPRRLREYKIPEKIKPQVIRQIQTLLDIGVIKHSTSPMASPLVCVLKGPCGRDGVRLATDFRYLNRYTVSDAFPIPDIWDTIQRIGNAKCISTCDFSQGYWQTEIAPEDQWKSAFICDDQLYEWTRTPFGMKSSGQTFCRALRQVLSPIRNIAASFVDDVAVHSSLFQQHLIDLDKFLSVVRKAGMTLKLKKCRWCHPEVIFCGVIVGSGNRRPDPQKVAAIDNIKIPQTKRQVRQILGFFNYFRDNIPNFAAKAQALTDLTKNDKSSKIKWGAKEGQSFDELKDALKLATQQPLMIIDLNKPYHLLVDSSSHTIAGVLTQWKNDQKECPIAFFSWKLSETQQKWPIVEKEAYAALKTLNRVRHWVFTSFVTLWSDHNPLTYLTESAAKSPRLLRWSLALQEYNVVFQYRAGRSHVVPDVLTRLCENDEN